MTNVFTNKNLYDYAKSKCFQRKLSTMLIGFSLPHIETVESPSCELYNILFLKFCIGFYPPKHLPNWATGRLVNLFVTLEAKYLMVKQCQASMFSEQRSISSIKSLKRIKKKLKSRTGRYTFIDLCIKFSFMELTQSIKLKLMLN